MFAALVMDTIRSSPSEPKRALAVPALSAPGRDATGRLGNSGGSCCVGPRQTTTRRSEPNRMGDPDRSAGVVGADVVNHRAHEPAITGWSLPAALQPSTVIPRRSLGTCIGPVILRDCAGFVSPIAPWAPVVVNRGASGCRTSDAAGSGQSSRAVAAGSPKETMAATPHNAHRHIAAISKRRATGITPASWSGSLRMSPVSSGLVPCAGPSGIAFEGTDSITIRARSADADPASHARGSSARTPASRAATVFPRKPWGACPEEAARDRRP